MVLAKVGVEGSHPFARSNFLPQASWHTANLILRSRAKRGVSKDEVVTH